MKSMAKGRSKKRGKMTREELRILLTELGLLLFAGVIVIRLLYIQLWERSKYEAMARKQYVLEIPLEAKRGVIYDRNMNALVMNEPCISVGLDKRQMEGTSQQYAKRLAPVLGVSASWLRNRIRSVKGQFVWLRRRMDVEVAARITALNLPGIRLEKETRRVYPHHEIASHIIGFTDVDNRGIEGVELEFNELLSGEDGFITIQRDGFGRAVPENVIHRKEPVDGKSLVLTIDYILQTIATEELRNAINLYNAKSGTVVILNPQTGEILAMANEPSYNPNRAGKYSFEARRNRAVTDAYEPGSTFKIVAFAAALENRLKTADDLIFCENGIYTLRGRRIRDTKPHAWLTMQDVLAYSSNIGTVKMALELGEQRLYDMARKFGFGRETGVALPGETPGILRPISKWTSFSLASMSIGQELACNTLQLAMAYAAVANGGELLKPRIASEVIGPDRRKEPISYRQSVGRVISPETAQQLKSMLIRTVEKGTGQAAKIEGLKIAGKTGTAQRPLANGRGYSRDEFVASFVGFFPADRPKYLVLVKLDTDKEHQWGGKTAAPTFKRIVQKIRAYDRALQSEKALFTHRNGTTDKNGRQAATQELNSIVLPDLTNRQLSAVKAILEGLSLKMKAEGSGDFVLNQQPAPGTRMHKGQEVVLQLFEVVAADGYLKMPDVTGLPLRQALSKLSVMGLKPVVYGHGKVIRQKPEPGSQVRTGIRVVVECEPEVVLPTSVKVGYEQ